MSSCGYREGGGRADTGAGRGRNTAQGEVVEGG